MTARDQATLRDRLRAVEAERDELRRDYGDMIALDTEGLRARIAEMEDAAEQQRRALAAVTAEAEQYRKWWKDAIADVTTYSASADVKAAAEERKRLEAMLDEAYRENEADCAEFALAAGQPVADRIAEHRHTIRQLTHQLNDALAALESAKSELTRWKQSTAFAVDPSQSEAERTFIANHDTRHDGENQGSIGGRFTYSFCVTSIGHVASLRCGACGESIDLTGDL